MYWGEVVIFHWVTRLIITILILDVDMNNRCPAVGTKLMRARRTCDSFT